MESFSPNKCEGTESMSKAVFGKLIRDLGSSKQVAIRRETEDIREMVDRREPTKYSKMLSGSKREGLRMEGSDIDYMYWLNNHRVIMDMPQRKHYNTANTTLIFADSSESPPGFTLLRLLTSSKNREILLSCFKMGDGNFYISSSVYRETTLPQIFPNSAVHGPCSSGDLAGTEYDIAMCLVSDFWPPSASSWINRCQLWPEPEVVNDIVRNGCHFVAIGHPLGIHENEEWRISFSKAEQKCVYAMNHCQFLIYGLLKLFLKEVINQQSEEVNALLCSYHMKTAVFWTIQQNLLSFCTPQNLLTGFWTCFKLLLKWVYEGFCPNFFIPKNNMFLTKVYGSAQNSLFVKLHELYEKGLACLLQSSIGVCIDLALNKPQLRFCIDENEIRNEVDCDLEFFNECYSLIGTKIVLSTVEELICSRLTQCQIATLQNFTSCTLQFSAFKIHHPDTYNSVNKRTYITLRRSCHMLKFASKFGCVSDMLYVVMYYYKTLRYREALSVLEMTKTKLAKPYLMYEGRVDSDKYSAVFSGKSWSTKKRQAVARDIIFDNSICYINELLHEQQSSLQQKHHTLEIPLFVMLHFLEFLCYRHIETTLSKAALDTLQSLVQHNQDNNVHVISRDISWQILGICQQMTGDLQAALLSYLQSLRQMHHHRIKTATKMRMRVCMLLSQTRVNK